MVERNPFPVRMLLRLDNAVSVGPAVAGHHGEHVGGLCEGGHINLVVALLQRAVHHGLAVQCVQVPFGTIGRGGDHEPIHGRVGVYAECGSGQFIAHRGDGDGALMEALCEDAVLPREGGRERLTDGERHPCRGGDILKPAAAYDLLVEGLGVSCCRKQEERKDNDFMHGGLIVLNRPHK
jgi:hypothetical protein